MWVTSSRAEASCSLPTRLRSSSNSPSFFLFMTHPSSLMPGRGNHASARESHLAANVISPRMSSRRERHGHQELRGGKEVIRSFRASTKRPLCCGEVPVAQPLLAVHSTVPDCRFCSGHRQAESAANCRKSHRLPSRLPCALAFLRCHSEPAGLRDKVPGKGSLVLNKVARFAPELLAAGK